MPLIHRAATLPHYAAHLQPIWDALPRERRGFSWAPRAAPWGSPGRFDGDGGPILVAGLLDARRWPHRPVILLEHGAGQHYPGDPRSAQHGAFAGGDGLDNVIGFLTPSETVADRWRARYPETPAAVVGCPRLDQHHRDISPKNFARNVTSDPLQRRTVAVTFHHSHAQIPEQTGAWPHYIGALAGLRDDVRARGGELLGHGHPREERRWRRMWGDLGVEYEPDLDAVLRRADVLVGDNTSAMPEAASCGLSLVWLSAPWYRRDVEHGGRFWDWPQGQVHVEHPDDLIDGVRAAQVDSFAARAARHSLVLRVYANTDGGATERAVAAVLQWTDGLRS